MGLATLSATRTGADDDLNSRSEEWRRTGQPSALWPGIDARALDPAAAAIASAVARCLDGRRSSLGRADGADARVIGIAATILGVGPLLGYWIERGLLDVGAPLADRLAAHLGHGRARASRITGGVGPLVKALAAAGIVPIVIKGFHSAHTCFPEPGVRPFVDVDLIVSPADVVEAERALSSRGFAGGTATRPFKRQWAPPDVDGRIRSFDLWHTENPWHVELHGGVFFADLHRYGVHFGDPAADTATLGGIEARVLRPPLRLVATAAHFSAELYSMRLLRLVEMILAIRATDAPNAVDWAAVDEVMDRSKATRFAYPAFALIEQLTPGTVPQRVLDRTRQASSRLARYVIANVLPATPLLRQGSSLAEHLMWASNPAQFVGRAGRFLTPYMGASSWSEALGVYEVRMRRLFTGRVGVRFPR